MTQEEADNRQNWKELDGMTAYNLIECHAEDWNEIGLMMNAWLKAKTPDLSYVINWLENGCDVKSAIEELKIYQNLRK